MSIRVDTASWIPGAIVVGNRGLGVLAEDIPSEGDNGASFLYNDISLPADSGKEICGRITTWPSAGALYAYEDGSFEFSGAPDGQYSFNYQLYVDGVASGTGTVSLQVGASTVTISATTAAAVFAGSAGCGAAVSIDAVADASVSSGSSGSGSAASISALADAALFAGGAFVSPKAQIAAAVADAVFSGGAVPIQNSSALISALAESSVFSGGVVVAPRVSISVTTDDARFIGVASVGASVSISASTDDAVFSGGASIVGAIWPDPANVLLGVTYGPTGADYTGTATGGSGPSAESIAAAVLAALQATTIPVNIKQVNDVTVQGAGTKLNPWQPV